MIFVKKGLLAVSLCSLLGLLSVTWAQEAGQALVAEEEVENLPSLMELEHAYLEANGGLANINALNTLSISGKMVAPDGSESQFKLYRKRPNLLRMQVKQSGLEHRTVYDGKRGYRGILARGAPDQWRVFDTTEVTRLRSDSAMEGPFFKLRGRPEWMHLVGEVEVAGQAAYEIKVLNVEEIGYSRIWLSTEHFQEVKMERLEGESGEQVKEIFFSDFTQVSGVWVAQQIEYQMNGAVTQILAVERLRANVGIFDSFFQAPADLNE